MLGWLGRIQGRLLLDVQPTSEAVGAYSDLVVRLHVPLILDSIGQRIQVAALEGDSLDQYLHTAPRAIAHVGTGDGVVLTADSPVLNRFFRKYLERPGVLSVPSTWVRRSP